MSSRFSEFTAQVSAAYDFVIFDAPPIIPVTDSIVIGSKAETILLVAKYGAHPLDELRTCQQRLKNLGSRLKGCVFNDIKLVSVGGLYGYYKYDYNYKYNKADA
jgi:tyrosine-protein kinase Etk/Wzc